MHLALSGYRAMADGWSPLPTGGARRCLDMETDRSLLDDGRTLPRRPKAGKSQCRRRVEGSAATGPDARSHVRQQGCASGLNLSVAGLNGPSDKKRRARMRISAQPLIWQGIVHGRASTYQAIPVSVYWRTRRVFTTGAKPVATNRSTYSRSSTANMMKSVCTPGFSRRCSTTDNRWAIPRKLGGFPPVDRHKRLRCRDSVSGGYCNRYRSVLRDCQPV